MNRPACTARSISSWSQLAHALCQVLSKEAIGLLPEYVASDRPVIYADNNNTQQLIAQISQEPVIGFDSESRPSFRKGESHPVSLIQLATPTACYLFHRSLLSSFSLLQPIFGDPNILKVGVGLKSDKKSLLSQERIALEGIFDLESAFKSFGLKHQVGAKQLTAITLAKKLRKSKKASTSNWSKLPYSTFQERYAVEDATAPLDAFFVIRDCVIQLADRVDEKPPAYFCGFFDKSN